MPELLTRKICHAKNQNRLLTVQYLDRPFCPHCGANPSDSDIGGWFTKPHDLPYDTINVYILKNCPSCNKLSLLGFVGVDMRGKSDFVSLANYRPITHPTDTGHLTMFSDSINSLSPNFVKIYRQAELAEKNNLHDICGMGYRKALEFLAKDYAVRFFPHDAEEIKKAPLATVIRKWIQHNKIQTLLEKATWLGNDETHYERRQIDYSLSDMKQFIKACFTYIDSELAFEQAESIRPAMK